jgi:hypothetical protein
VVYYRVPTIVKKWGGPRTFNSPPTKKVGVRQPPWPLAPEAPDYRCLNNLSFTVNYNLSESFENNVVFC